MYAKPKINKKSTSGYVLCYFVGNEPEKERVHLAISPDGYHFTPLFSDRPIIEQKTGKKCLRDPFLIRGIDGLFHIIATDMKSDEGWESNHAFVSFESSDLINWKNETNIDIRDFGDEFLHTNRAWAPEAIFDENEGKFLVYWSHSTKEKNCPEIYCAYTTDFKSLSTPRPLFKRDNVPTIDADIIFDKKQKEYNLFFKFEEMSKIAVVKSKALLGPYDTEPKIVSLSQKGTEGSFIYNIDGTDTFVMIMDEYGAHRYFAQQTTDFEHFYELKREDFDLTKSPRHASVMKITKDEFSFLSNYIEP